MTRLLLKRTHLQGYAWKSISEQEHQASFNEEFLVHDTIASDIGTLFRQSQECIILTELASRMNLVPTLYENNLLTKTTISTNWSIFVHNPVRTY